MSGQRSGLRDEAAHTAALSPGVRLQTEAPARPGSRGFSLSSLLARCLRTEHGIGRRNREKANVPQLADSEGKIHTEDGTILRQDTLPSILDRRVKDGMLMKLADSKFDAAGGRL